MIDKAWRAVTSLTIHSCFKKPGFPSPNLVDVNDTLTEFNAEPFIWEALSEQDLTRDDYVLVDTDIAVWGALSDAEIVALEHNNTENDEDESQELTPTWRCGAPIQRDVCSDHQASSGVIVDFLVIRWQCITSVLSVFSSIVRDFLELFYNLWRTVLAKNKIVLDPALRLQSFRTPENATIGVRSGIRTHAHLSGLRSFLGLCTYYRKFVKGFSNIARPLHKLTESKQKFQWTKECEDSFLQLKEALTSSPILIYPQPDKPFILDTDASNESVGAVLSQEIDGQERVVAYWSKCLSKPERNYCVTRKELLAIVKAIEHFHHYLYG
ncbi:retrovirus-related Pol polyprotein from transposon 412 [Trichonephila clavipes]|nr:retrovirus-related Pol polyprotein from transposon 412 [Trichonephila clavipes]